MSRFKTTVWAQIEDAANQDPNAGDAFASRYRSPLLAFLRRRGFSTEDAEDVVQEVFLHLFSKDLLSKADSNRGRFRSYLLGVTNNVARNFKAKEGAKMRGGGWRRMSLQDAPGIPAQENDPQFDACWSESLVQRALEFLATENPRQYSVMTLHLQGDLSQQEIGEKLDRTASQVKTDLHRARQRLSRLIRQEIALYTSSQEEFDSEVRAFLSAVGGG